MRRLLGGYTGLLLAALYAPVVLMAVLSFNDGRYRAWEGFTGRWYAELLGDHEVRSALKNTLAIAGSATIDVLLQVSPGASLGPYFNSATASGTSPGGEEVEDVSQDGSDPDPQDDGPGDDGEPTPVGFPPFVVPVMSTLGLATLLLLTMMLGAAATRRARQ